AGAQAPPAGRRHRPEHSPMTAAPLLLEPETESPTLPRLLAGLASNGASPVPLAGHRRQYPAPTLSARPHMGILTAIEQSGLRGRGGAGFPTGRKMRAVADRCKGKPLVVVNGSEGEPASEKDKLLLTRHPHLVLDGALLAAAAVGATEVVVCIDRNATGALRSVRAAVAERARTERTAGAIRVAAIPARYVA